MDPLLVNKEDFDEFKDISDNMDLDRLNALIRQSQIMDVRPFLGSELYLLLLAGYDDKDNTFADQIFTDLFFGVDYNNIRFYGLKPMLISYVYARLISDINVNITRTGVRRFNAEESEEVTQAQINTKHSAAISEGLLYQQDAELFLQFKASDYPTFDTEREKTTGMTWFKVGAGPDPRRGLTALDDHRPF